MVPSMPYSSSMSRMRQTPTRLPYSKNDSFARSRSPRATGDGDSPTVSPCGSPSRMEFSDPSS